jgi:uncharacterized membrane protein YgcG
MFVIMVGTNSAVLFTLVVMLLSKTVAGKHVRQAVAYDPVDLSHDPMTKNEHHDWTKDTIRSLQAVTSCDVPGEVPIVSNWSGGYCFQSDLVDCCGTLLDYTTCDAGYYPYSLNWKDGVCSAFDKSYCCVTYVTSCDEPGEGRIDANFAWDEVNKFFFCYPGVSECCGPLQINSAIMCNGDVPLQYPEYWNDGVCSVAVESGSVVVQSDCCYNEDGILQYAFESCYESQEQIPGKWYNGFCVANFLLDCCRSVSGATSSGNGGTTSSGNGGTTSSGNGGTTSSGYGGSTSRDYGGTTSSESSSGGLIAGIVVALLIIAVLVTLISCACYPSCPWYSKMNCFPKNQPSPTTNTTASSNDPIKEVDTEDRSITEEPESAAPESTGPTEAHTNIERLSSVLASAGKIYHTVSHVSSTVESVTASINNVAQFVAAASAVQAEQTV